MLQASVQGLVVLLDVIYLPGNAFLESVETLIQLINRLYNLYNG